MTEQRKQKDFPGWCRGIIAKRTPDALAILADLIKAGLSRGYCTANDITPRKLSEPNVVGGVFKLLPQLGFVQTGERVKPEHKQKHGRLLFVWELRESTKAYAFLREIRATFFQQHDMPKQGVLGL